MHTKIILTLDGLIMVNVKAENSIDYQLKMAWTRFARIYSSQAAQHDTTLTVGYILLNIDKTEGTPSTKLGPLIGMEPRSLVRTLKGMEEEGLITREPDPEDGRSVRIKLTNKGLTKRATSKNVVVSLNEKLIGNIPAKKLGVFFEVIKDINALLETEMKMEDAIKN